MATGSAHRSRLLAVLAGALLVGGLAAPPALAAPAPDEPPPTVDVGIEGAQAALVRIEVTAVTNIAHINHSTGDLVIHQDSYPVRQGQATGVLVSADGIVATLGRELAVDLDRITVPAANQLFVEHIGAQLVAGNGSSSPTSATDPDLDQHLHHCYQRVDHCIVTADLQYDVVLLTEEPQRVRAVPVFGEGGGPTDVVLLRVGGSATPTAALSTGEVPAEATLAGFDTGVPEDPAGWAPATVPVQVAGGTVTAAADQGLRDRLGAGLTGGPLLDPESGEVLGLVDWDRSGDGGTVVGAAAISDALAEAGIGTDRSPFDVAFTRGLELFNDGRYGAAAQRLEAAGEYFESALADRHRQTATDLAAGEEPAAAEPADGERGTPWWLWAAVAGGALVLLLLLWWLVARRRSRRSGPPAAPGPPAPGAPVPGAPVPGARHDAEPAPVLLGPSSMPPPPWPSPPSPVPPAGVPAPRPAGPPAAGAPVAVAPVPVRAGEPSWPPVPPGAAAAGPPSGRRPAFCVNCGEGVPAQGRYCGACGSPVPG